MSYSHGGPLLCRLRGTGVPERQSLSCKTLISALNPRCLQHSRVAALDNAVDSYNPLETASIKQITSRETIETRASRHKIRQF